MDALTILAVAFAAVAFTAAVFVVTACLLPPAAPVHVVRFEVPSASRITVSGPAAKTARRPVVKLAKRTAYNLNASRLDLMVAAKSWASDRIPLGGVSAFGIRMNDLAPYAIPPEHISKN